MNATRKVLVAYATRLNSTLDIAEEIEKTLTKAGASVELHHIEAVEDVSQYDAVIIGSAIRVGKWLPEAVNFLVRFREELRQIPVAFFTVCITMSEDTPENRQLVMGYMQELKTATPEVYPVDIGLFAGKLYPKELSWLLRQYIRIAKIPTGDYRNWDAVRNWSRRVYPKLMASHVETAIPMFPTPI